MTAIIVMAKAPQPGLAKTRLMPALGAAGAAQLARRFLHETLRAALAADIGPVTLCGTPDAPLHFAFEDLLRRLPLQWAAQGEGDLGARMARSLARALRLHDSALLIGTDAPALDAAYLRNAQHALTSHDAVLAPTADGGYALVGLRRMHAALFTHMPWSGPEVMARTRQRLLDLGLSWAELPLLHDIDEPADLVHVPPAWLRDAGAVLPALNDALHLALRDALRVPFPQWAGCAIEALPDKGLAHVHLRLVGSGLLARVPKQSQMGLDAPSHLAYEAACFERAAPCGHTPQIHGVLAPTAALPRGALLVQEIVGRPLWLAQDLDAMLQALAALHALPVPAPAARAPLLDPADPLAALLAEIDSQAQHLDAALLAPLARERIDAELLRLRTLCASSPRPLKQLICFDAHPGNFLVEASGRAVLVDLEKARYGAAPLDLAHATLYTSTTWDVASSAVLTPQQVANAYEAWTAMMPPAMVQREWLVPLRRAMYLWSITWCAKWRGLATQHASTVAEGEDWSGELSDAALVAHVRGRVDHYLSPTIVQQICDDTLAIERALAT